jgi:pimeloyl-ACP methyl ester carboxylesterase
MVNLTLDEELHEAIIKAGWITIFVQWMQGDDLYLQLLATKALVNMDKDYECPPGVMEDGIYQYHPHCRTHAPMHADIIFIPGLLGGPAWTWRQSGTDKDTLSKCWPKDWLAKDCPHVRILTLEYDTSLSTWSPACPYESERTLKKRSAIYLQKLLKAGVGERPIVWVGHSMGGLLIKSILVQDEAEVLRKLTRGVVFFSVPHKGSDTASWAADSSRKYILFPSIEVKELVRRSPALEDLHAVFKNIATNGDVPVMSFGEGLPIKMRLRQNGKEWVKMLLVPPESSDPQIGVYHFMQDLNHMNICKPDSRKSFLYQHLVEFIFKCVPALGVFSLKDLLFD